MTYRYLLSGRYYALLLLLLLPLTGKAQTFGNEWINYNQQYFKIPTTQSGIYRITKSDLQAAGFPVVAVDPRRMQLFHRGQEQAVYINGEGDAIFNDDDYIEFYGQGNDGTLDAELYQPASAQPHPYYNLYSDTTAYFLTWRLDNGLGKRMENFYEPNTSNLPAETFHWEEKRLVLTNVYSAGRRFDERNIDGEASFGHYDYGEGWTDTVVVKKFYSYDYSFTDIANVTDVGQKPKLEVVIAGRLNVKHQVEISAGPNAAGLRSLGIGEFYYFSTYKFTKELEVSDISPAGEIVVRLRVNGFADTNSDAASVSLIRVLFPQAVNAMGASQKTFMLHANPADKSYVEIGNPAPGAVLFDITNPNSVRRVSTSLVGGKLAAVINRTSQGRNLFMNTGFISSPALRRIRFRNIDPAVPNYIVISHPSLMKPAGGFPDVVRGYAGYRASAAGGGYDTLVVDVDLLYNQFSYGELTPLAFRRFADFMTKKGKPESMFLIGRSYYPQAMRKDPNRYSKDLVPTGGYPGSDVALTAGLEGVPFVPSIPTGRINATTPQHVLDYLNKVKEHESTLADALWRKNLLHLSGGRTPHELRQFKFYVDDFKLVAQGAYLGGKVATLSKKTDSSVELINVAEQVNNGISLLTFFGHSSPDYTDIEIGNCSNDVLGYRNKGRYPMILVNGCLAGDIFGGRPTFGEDWILTPNRGAVLFMAHSGTGYTVPLKRFTDWFYRTAFGDSTYIGKPAGAIHKETIRRFTNGLTQDDLYTTHAEAITLQGDPAVSLAPLTKPDYYTSGSQLFLKSFDNSQITAATDSFQVGIIVSNYGSINRNPFPVSVKRTYGDGTVQQYDTVFYAPVFYQDTLYFTVKNAGIISGGSQRFEVSLDVTNKIAELNEMNNLGVLEYIMPSVGAIPLFPREYSIVNKQPVQFVAQSTVTPVRSRSYLIELDTAHTFTSPGKRSTTVTAGLLPMWTTDLLSAAQSHDSTVYYWRIRYADLPEGADNTWAESSFIYISNSPEGWSQSRFPQFSKASLNRINRNTNTVKWEFAEVSTRIKVTTYGINSSVEAYKKVELIVNNGTVVFDGRCGANNLVGVAFNKATVQPYSVNPALNCGRDPYISNALSDGYLNSGGLAAYIDAVPFGDYVLLFTSGGINFTGWTAGMQQKLTEIGADPDKVTQLQNGHPYIILGKKGGAPGSATEILADYTAAITPDGQVLTLESNLPGRFDKGVIMSTLIGPASQWGTLYHAIKLSEDFSYDHWQLDVVGLNLQGQETVVAKDIKNSPLPIDFINSVQYPYLKLRLQAKDTVNLTPPQLYKWQVIYDGVPEGLINPEMVAADTYQVPEKTEGENFTLPFVFHNISPRPFTDSLTVQYTLLNITSRRQQVYSFKVKPLAAGDTVKFTIPVKAADMGGNNRLQVFVNPRIQLEQNYANNIFEVPFKVYQDKIHPVLDVTFDGVRIMDGDIVSPSPLIAVSLKDENKLQIKKDTVGMELYLKKCKDCPYERIALNSPEVRWVPAGGENDFRLEYQPKGLTDGIYTLSVQGTDVSGNLSSVRESPYRISFEVVNESRITHFYPYPNPFSSSTRFVFTLTGAVIPDQIKIQIMTVSGKVVREITQDELGPIRIGNNISAYAWDGADEFGDKLANGVYLYRVITKAGGQTIERRATAADKAFHKEYGKLYILR